MLRKFYDCSTIFKIRFVPVQPSSQGFPWDVEYPSTSGHTEGVNDYPDSSGNVYRRITFKDEAADNHACFSIHFVTIPAILSPSNIALCMCSGSSAQCFLMPL